MAGVLYRTLNSIMCDDIATHICSYPTFSFEKDNNVASYSYVTSYVRIRIAINYSYTSELFGLKIMIYYLSEYGAPSVCKLNQLYDNVAYG